ncbi:UNVERIFIED_CONTAM: hypothetical protein PYX00_005619 [Menopon gallinae]|uniref:Mediator of RNA polymerase II transcription subunit 25 n=1 Tax=Menopon gallinae TaxID=328185 RepID=A0AAW2HSE7_9NEOP
MVVGMNDHAMQADIIFVIEGTAINGAYLNDLKTNYLMPTLEYFSQGNIEDRDYVCESTSTLYGLVVYHAADILPKPSIDCYGPYSSPQRLLMTLDKLELIGGKGESHANIAEGLATALHAFEDLQQKREGTNIMTQKHCILVCNSPPYFMPVMESPTYAGHTTDQLAAILNEQNINLSILSPRKIPAIFKLFEKAGGDLTQSQNKNYAKDPRHLVLLKGFSLKERPLSPTAGGTTNLPIPSLPSPVANDGSPMTTVNQMAQQTQPLTAPPPGYRPPQQAAPVMGQQQSQVQIQQQLQQPQIAGRPPFQQTGPPGYPTRGQTTRWPMAPPVPLAQQRTFMAPQTGPGPGQGSALIAQLTQPPSAQFPQRLDGPVMGQQMIPQQQQQQTQQMRMPTMTIGPQANQMGPGGLGGVPIVSQGVMGQNMGPQNTLAQQATMGQNVMGTSATIIPSPIITQNMQGQGQAMTGPGPQTIQGQVTNTMQTSSATTTQTPFQGQTGQVLGPGANQAMQSGNLVLPPTANQGLQGPVPVSQNAPVPPAQQTVTQQQQQQQQQPPLAQPGPGPGMPVRERHTIWQGVLEWVEKGNDNTKVTRHVPCQVSCTPKEGERDLKADSWPQKLIMQLMPKQLIGNIGGAYLKNSTSVLFHPQQCEALESLTKVMSNNFAGCVHFTSAPTSAPCDIKVLLLFYTMNEKRAYLGFIPNDQVAFVDRLRKVIQQQKNTHAAIMRQNQVGGTPNAPNQPGANPPISGVGPTTSQGGIMMNQTNTMTMGAGQITQTQDSHVPGVQGMGPTPAAGQGRGGPMIGTPQRPPFNQIEAARQQNLVKIHQLQQTLEAAQQQEIQYKSQLEIINHMKIQQLQQNLEQAQQQEVHYQTQQAQMEQEQKQQLRAQLQQMQQQRQLTPQQIQQQQQQQQQTTTAAQPQQPTQQRMMRPQLTGNPGLRHLLQQQQQPTFRQHVMGMQQMPQRPGNAAAGQANQQFDDVSNFDFIN